MNKFSKLKFSITRSSACILGLCPKTIVELDLTPWSRLVPRYQCYGDPARVECERHSEIIAK